jgi:hypothetical protein
VVVNEKGVVLVFSVKPSFLDELSTDVFAAEQVAVYVKDSPYSKIRFTAHLHHHPTISHTVSCPHQHNP